MQAHYKEKRRALFPDVECCESFLRFTRNIHVHLRAAKRKIKRFLTMRGKDLKGFLRCFGAVGFA